MLDKLSFLSSKIITITYLIKKWSPNRLPSIFKNSRYNKKNRFIRKNKMLILYINTITSFSFIFK